MAIGKENMVIEWWSQGLDSSMHDLCRGSTIFIIIPIVNINVLTR